MPFDPVTIRTTFQPRARFGEHDQVIIREYIAPASSEVEGVAAHDPYKEQDQRLAAKIKDDLDTNFPTAYGWQIVADVAQGWAGMRLWMLMPPNHYAFINLWQSPNVRREVFNLGGELLERYRQSRERFNIADYLDARAKYSGLVNRRALIPS